MALSGPDPGDLPAMTSAERGSGRHGPPGAVGGGAESGRRLGVTPSTCPDPKVRGCCRVSSGSSARAHSICRNFLPCKVSGGDGR